MELYFSVLFFIFGVVIGSFLNVCAYRIPRGISVAQGRSMCPQCEHTLGGRDLVPVFSYLFLRGKCRYCGERISPRYACVELATGILFLLVFLTFGFAWQSVLGCAFVSVLVVVTLIDWDTREIPDRMHIIIAALAIFIILLNPSGWYWHLIGAAVVSLPMLLIAIFTGGFGGGDIKLMAAAGLYLGMAHVLVAFFVGAIAAVVYAMVMMARKKLDRKSMIAFGPFLSVGCVVALLAGTQVMDAYFSLFW